MKNKWMHIDILVQSRMKLHDHFIVLPQQVLDEAHLVPGRQAFGFASLMDLDRYVFPTHLVADDEQEFGFTAPCAECTVETPFGLGCQWAGSEARFL